MHAYATPVFRLLTLEALHHFLHAQSHQLTFVDVAQASAIKKCIYVHVGADDGIYYTGKGSQSKRPRDYARMHAGYLADGGIADPKSLPEVDQELTLWAPIVRFDVVHQMAIKVADLTGVEDVIDPHTGNTFEKSAGWEARIKAFIGTCTGVESVIGGGSWEANAGTLRGAGYAWVREQLSQYRAAHPDSDLFI